MHSNDTYLCIYTWVIIDNTYCTQRRDILNFDRQPYTFSGFTLRGNSFTYRMCSMRILSRLQKGHMLNTRVNSLLGEVVYIKVQDHVIVTYIYVLYHM